MSNEALNWARSQPITDAEGKGVLIALADRADKWGMCWPGVGRLVADTGKSDATVRRHLSKLESLELIMVRPRERSDGSHRSNEYCLVTGQSFEVFFTSKVTPAPVTVTPPPVTMTDHEPSENHQVPSLSLELDELEKNSPRDLLCAAFEENFFEVLLSEEPRRQMLWLALSSETIADAVSQANDAPGNFRTALKHRLDVDSGLAGLRTKKSSGPRREPRPPPAATTDAPVPGQKPVEAVVQAQVEQRAADEALPPPDPDGLERGIRHLERRTAAERDPDKRERLTVQLRRMRTGDGARASPDPERDDEAKTNLARLRLEQQRKTLLEET